jgi:hypothetical protein
MLPSPRHSPPYFQAHKWLHCPQLVRVVFQRVEQEEGVLCSSGQEGRDSALARRPMVGELCSHTCGLIHLI